MYAYMHMYIYARGLVQRTPLETPDGSKDLTTRKRTRMRDRKNKAVMIQCVVLPPGPPMINVVFVAGVVWVVV